MEQNKQVVVIPEFPPLPERVTDCALTGKKPILDGTLQLGKVVGSGAQGRVYEALVVNKLTNVSRKVWVALKVSKNEGSCKHKKRANTRDRKRFPDTKLFEDIVCVDSAKLEMYAYTLLAEQNLSTIPRVYATTKCGTNRFLISQFIPHAKPFQEVNDDLLLNNIDIVTVLMLYTIMHMQRLRMSHFDIHAYNILIQGPAIAKNYNAIKTIKIANQDVDIQQIQGYRKLIPYLIDFGFVAHERKDGSLLRGPYRSAHYDPAIDLHSLAQMFIEWYPNDVTIGEMRKAGTIYTVQFLELLLDDSLKDKQLVTKINLPNAYVQNEKFAEHILTQMFLRK